MKPLILALTGATAMALAGVGCSTANTARSANTTFHRTAAKESVPLTGSYIKKDVQRAGMITTGPDNVLVVDQDMIATSGASDLKQVLVRRGIR